MTGWTDDARKSSLDARRNKKTGKKKTYVRNRVAKTPREKAIDKFGEAYVETFMDELK
jgi:hypothetical protein